MAKRFGPDDIAARAGLKRSTEPAQAASSGGNTLFVSALSVIFVAGAGVLLASDGAAGLRGAVMADIMGPPAEVYKSQVARDCDPGWKDDGINRDQIHCYMTRDIPRLCDPRERLALVDKLRAYHEAQERYLARMDRAAMEILTHRGGVMAMGIAEAKSRDPNLSDAERAVQMNKALETSQEILSPSEKIQAENTNTVSSEEAVADVKDLVELGFLSAADFPTVVPKIVKKGLAAAGHVAPSYCR